VGERRRDVADEVVDRLVLEDEHQAARDERRQDGHRERGLEPPPRLPRGRDVVSHHDEPARPRRATRSRVALVAEIVDHAHGGALFSSLITRKNAASTLWRITPSWRTCSPAALARWNTSSVVAC